MKEKLQNFFNVHTCGIIAFLIIAFQPIIDLDYLIYPFLNQFGIPRPSTIIRFLIIPFLIIWVWWKKDQNKKRTFIFSFIYIAILSVYFVLHCKNASGLYERLNLTTNFEFVLSYEFTYCFTLVIPYFIMYMIYQLNWKEDVLKMLKKWRLIPYLLLLLFLFQL